MRSNISLRAVLVFFLALAILGLAAGPAGAATLTWDQNAGTAGQTDGTGTWLNANQWWDSVGSANVTWNNGTPDDAIIGVGGAGGTITLGTVTAGTVLLNNFTGTYTLSGGSLNQSGGITIGATAGNVTISTPISGAGGLTNNGPGTLTLSYNANQFTGNTLISNGKVKLGAQYALWKSAYDTTGSTGAIGLDVTGQVAPVLGGLAGGVDLATAVTAYGSMTGLTLNPQTGASNTYSGVIANGAANMTLTKIGDGTQTLTGTNSYSGATNIYDGTLALGGASGSILNSAVTVRGGTLSLDNSSAWADRLANATALSLGSLTLTSFNGAGAQTETVGATTFAVGGKVTINNGATAGDQTTLALGTVTRSAGAAINFVGTGGTLGSGANSPNVTSTGAFPGTVNGILPWATVGGTQWAENNAGSIRAYSGTFVDPTSAASAATANAQLTGSGAIGSAKSFNSLNVIASGAGQSLNLSASAGDLTLTSGAILKSGTDAYTISSSGSPTLGKITAGAELIAQVDGGDLTISAPLNTAIVGLAKGGTGKLVLSGTRNATFTGNIGIAGGTLEFQGLGTSLNGTISGPGGLICNLNAGQKLRLLAWGATNGNTYSGPTVVKGGILEIGNGYDMMGNYPGVLGSSIASAGQGLLSNLELNGGNLAVRYYMSEFLGSGPGQFQITGGVSGISNYQGDAGAPIWTINADANYEVVWGALGEGAATGYFNPSTFVLQDSTMTANNSYTFAKIPNKFDLNGATRTIAVDSNPNATPYSGAHIGGVLSGIIRNSSGTAGITKIGIGILDLQGANTYNGPTTISGGILMPNTSAALGDSSATNTLIFTGGTLKAGGAITSAATRGVTLTSTGIIDTNGQAVSIAGNMSGGGGLSKIGTGTLTLSGTNDYAGTTTVNAGTLQFANQVALYNNIPGNWTAANINVKGGATLALNVDSAGTAGLTSTNLDTLLTNISVANTAAEGLQSGVILALDTTTAAGATFTQGNAIANSTGVFGGQISLTKLGTGTLVLDKTNTYTGPTTISAGTLQIGGTGSLGSGSYAGIIANSGTFTYSSSAAQTLSGIIGGTGSLIKDTSSSSTLTLSAANTYTGLTKVSAGILALGNSLALQNSALDTTNSIAGDASNGLQTNQAALTLGGLTGTKNFAATGGVFTTTSGGYDSVTALTLNPISGTVTYGGVIANGLPAGMTLTKTGAGTQVLQGANTYTGATNLNAGTLTLSGASGALASTSINLNGGNLTLDNSSTTGNSGARLSDSAAIAVNGKSALNFTHNAATATDYAETIGTLDLQSGFLTYTGSQANATGPRASNLNFSTLSRTGSTNTATVNFAGTGLGTNTRNTITFGSGVTNGVDLGPWAVVNGADFATYDTTLGVKALTSSTLAVNSNSATTNFNSNAASITFDASLNPSLKTLLVNSTTARTTAINGNTVSVGGISTTGQTHIISGTGAVQALGAGDPLYINVGANALTFSSVIQNFGAGATASALVKSGAGTLTLSGTNTFSGDIVINAGTMDNANVGTFGTGSKITFAGSGTVIPAYGASPVFAKSIAVNPGVTATLNVPNQYYNMTFTAPVTGDATSTLSVICSDNGAGSVTLSNASNMFTGTLQVGDATYGSTLTVNSLADSVSPIKLYGNSSRPAYFNLGAGTASSLLFDSRQIQLLGGAGASAFIRNNNGTTANTITINTDLSVGASVNRTLTLGGSNTGANTFGGKIGDGPGAVVSLTKADGGTWILSGANTYTGATTISGGTLQIGNGGMTGSLSPFSTITDSATLKFNRSNTITQGTDFSSVIAGTGAVVQAGTGTTILTGTNTYTGVTTVNAGTLLINSPGSLASGSAVTVNNGGTLGGNGIINGTVNVAAGGHIAPGASVGTLNVNNTVTVATGGIWDIDLNASTSAIDLLNVTGNLAWSGTQTLNLNILAGTPGGPYTFATWTGTGSSIGTWNVLPSGTAGANHWIGGQNLLWDTQDNWDPSTSISGTVALSGKNLQVTTSVVSAPASVSTIYIDPSANVVVTGPASSGGVKNLTIGQGLGTYTAALALQAGGDLTVTGTTTIRSDGTLTAVGAGLISPILNINGGLATLDNAANNVTTANVAAGTLTVNAGTLSTANLSGTGSLAGSAAANQVNVTAGAPVFSGNATAMTVTGGGITTTGGTIGTFNSNTGAGTSTIGAGTAVTTAANVAAGIVNFNSTQANGTLAVTGGTTNIGSGAKVATANFQSGTGTVNAANPLAITSTLKLPGGITATLADAASFTAAGANLVDNNVARTLSLSGGTLAVSVPGLGAPINLSSTGLNIADATHIKAASYYTNDNRAPYCVSNWSGMTGSVGASATADNGSGGKTWLDYPNSAGTSWISWDLGAEYTIGSIHIWNYNEVNLPNRGTKKLNLQVGDATAFASNTGWVSQLSNVDWTSIGANGTITGTVQGTGQNGYAGFDWTLPAPITTRYLRFETLEHFAGGDSVGLSEVLFYTAVVTEVNLPKTTIAATSASTFDTSGSPATLGGLAIKGGSLTIGTESAPTDLTMVDGFTYRWEYNGTANTVDVTGDLTLDGAWTLDLGGTATPTPGVKYDLFTYDTFLGTLAAPAIDKSDVPGWLTPTITKEAGRIYMTFGAMGDTNGDGVVDAADFITLKKNFGRTDAPNAQNGNFTTGDNDVNWADLNILTNAMAGTGGGAPAMTPEPATLALLALGALAVIRRRRK